MSRKLTYEEVKERFINKGYELISQEYINANTKLEYICPKHRDKGIQEISIGSLSKHGCYWCGLESRSNKRKNTYCLKNKIPLLRIPYWEFDNIEKILNEALVNKDSAFLIA